MSTSRITAHFLDTTSGRPAVGVAARLEVHDPDGWREIGSGVSNDDGRITNLGPAELDAGDYRIEVDTGAYYRRIGTESFFRSVCLGIVLDDPSRHCHVPLLIGPFSICTYRGS